MAFLLDPRPVPAQSTRYTPLTLGLTPFLISTNEYCSVTVVSGVPSSWVVSSTVSSDTVTVS